MLCHDAHFHSAFRCRTLRVCCDFIDGLSDSLVWYIISSWMASLSQAALALPFTQWNLVFVSMTLQMCDKLQKRFGVVPDLMDLSGSASTRMNGMPAIGCSYLGFLWAFDCCQICVCDLSWQPHPVGDVVLWVSLAVASIRFWSRDC